MGAIQDTASDASTTDLSVRSDAHISASVLLSRMSQQNRMRMTHLVGCGKGDKPDIDIDVR